MPYTFQLMHRLGHTHRLAFVLAAMLLPLGALAPTTILCVGSNGHSAIEAALARCCDPAQSHGDTGLSLSAGERCDDYCTDTPVGIYAACRSLEHTTPALHMLALAGPVLFAASPATTLRSGRSLGRLTSPPPRALRTTVSIC